MKKAEPLRMRDDDEGPVPQVPVDGAGHGLHAFGDLARFVAPFESHGPTSRVLAVSDEIDRTNRTPARDARGRIVRAPPRRSKRMRRPASKRKSSPRGEQREQPLALAPRHGRLARAGEGRGQAREGEALELRRSEPRASAASMSTPSGPIVRRAGGCARRTRTRGAAARRRAGRSRGPSRAATLRRPASPAGARACGARGCAPGAGRRWRRRGETRCRARRETAGSPARDTESSGRTTPSARLSRGPASAARPPRRSRASTCDSTASSRWCAVATIAGPRLRGHLGERRVADVPRAGLRREAELARRAPGVAAPREEGEPEPPRVLGHEREVPIALLRPPAVVDVADRQAASRSRAATSTAP